MTGDITTLAAALHEALRDRQASIATAESLTGGLVGAALTDLAGSSATYRGGVVAYATGLKASLLGVDPALLERHGPVHAEVAAAMARGVRVRCGATYGLATTGVAGPDPQDGRQPGEVHVAVAGPGTGPLGVRTASRQHAGDRADVRRETVREALLLALQTVTGAGNADR